MAYTQNLNEIKELLKPGIAIPTAITFIAGLLWMVYLGKLWSYNTITIVFPFIMVLIATVGVISLSLVFNTSREMKDQLHWPETMGEITVSSCDRSALTTRTGPDNENSALRTQSVFTPRISYRYFVDSREYNGTGISGPLTEGCNTAQETEAVLQSYPVGKKVPVFYSRRHPATAILERNAPPIISFPLLVGLLFIVGSLFFGWALTINACYEGDTPESQSFFGIPPKMQLDVDRCLGKVQDVIESHPKFKSGLMHLVQGISKIVEREYVLPKKKMETKIKWIIGDEQKDEDGRLTAIIQTFWDAHYYREAIEYSQMLAAITANDFFNNYYAMRNLALIYAESGQMEEAESILHKIRNRWGDELKKEEITLEEDFREIHELPPGKPAKEPLTDRFWEKDIKTDVSHPKLRTCSPSLSKSELQNEIAKIDKFYQDNDRERLNQSMYAYWNAHYYDEAAGCAKKLIEITSNDFHENFYNTSILAQILAGANRTKEAEKVLHMFADKWSLEMERTGTRLEEYIVTVRTMPRGTPPKE